MIAASLLGLAVLGGLGVAFATARRRRSAGEYEEEYRDLEPEAIAPEQVAPAEPMLARPEPAPVMPAPAFAAAPAAPGAPAVLDSSADREALIARMVAAPPDAENPYTSPAKRRRKARMILAARDQEQAEASSAFDFRSYRPTGSARVDSEVDSVDA